MWLSSSSSCSPVSGTGRVFAPGEPVSSSICLTSPAEAAVSASSQSVTRSQHESFLLRSGSHRLHSSCTESVEAVAAIADACTISQGLTPVLLPCYSHAWLRYHVVSSLRPSRLSAVPPSPLRCSLSRVWLCSLLTPPAAATPMSASTGARRHTVRLSPRRPQHTLVTQGVTPRYSSHNTRIRRCLDTALEVGGLCAPSTLRLSVAARALTTATTPLVARDSDAPPASPESFLDLNEAPMRTVLSNSGAVGSGLDSAPSRKESSHRFSSKQQRSQAAHHEKSSRSKSEQIKERRGGSQSPSHQHGHGPRSRRGGRNSQPSVPEQRQERQSGPPPPKERRSVHSSRHHGAPTSLTASSSTGGGSGRDTQGYSLRRRRGTASSLATPKKFGDEEEVCTTWSGSAERRGGGFSTPHCRSAGDNATASQSTEFASCAARTSPLSPPIPDRVVYTNTGKPNCAALRRLLKSHHTFRQNYETLQKNERVAIAFERLCAEAVAHSRLLEHVVSALGSATTATTPVRLLLTGTPERGVAADARADVASPAGERGAETLAVLEVPPAVMDWLNEPIVVPELSVTALMESLQTMLSITSADEGLTSCTDGAASGESCPTAAGALPAATDRYVSGAAVKVWYDAWGRQQHPCQSAKDAPGSATASTAPSLTSSMAIWHHRQCALRDVLLSHLTEGGQPSSEDARCVLPTTPQDVNAGDTSHTGFDPTATADTNRTPAQPTDRAVTRPDQITNLAPRALLPYLVELLQTLRVFKAAREEAKLQVEYYALPESTTSVNSKPSAAAAVVTDSQGGPYTHLCRVARRFHLTLVPDPPQPRPAPCDASHKQSSGGCGLDEELSSAAQAYLRSISKVDHVASHQISEEAERSADNTYAREASGASTLLPSPTEPTSAMPSYSAPVLDISIGVVLRCLLFYLPALSASDRFSVLQQLRAPWLTQAPEGGARAACWITLFSVADLLSMANTLKRQERVAALSPGMPEGRGDGNQNSNSFTIDKFTLSMLRGVVLELRSLCWPTVLDRHSSMVQQVLCLPPAEPAASSPPSSSVALASEHQPRRPRAEIPPSDATPGMSALTPVAIGLSRPAQARAPSWNDVVSVVQGSEKRQRLGYDLLVLFFGALQSGKILSFAAPLNETASAGAAASEKNTLLCQRPSDLRRLNTVCIYALDVDRFVTERMRTSSPTGGALSLLNVSSSLLNGSATSLPDSRLSLAQLLAAQTAWPYSLSRLALCTLGPSLLQSWSTISHQRVQLLMAALQRAVAAPTAPVLRSLLLTQPVGTRPGFPLSRITSPATPSHAMQLVARCAEWRAVAPVMAFYVSHACPALWSAMWAYVLSEMKSLPRQVGEVIRTTHAGTGDGLGDDTSAYGGQRQAISGMDVAFAKLEELATMCAWLIAMTPSVCGEHLTGGAASSASTHTSELVYIERVSAGFAHCIKSVLATWTQTGASVDVAEKLLSMFVRHTAGTTASVTQAPAKGVDNSGAVVEAPQDTSVSLLAPEEREKEEAALLLMGLGEAAQKHVWTRVLHSAVEEWIRKTRYIQAQPTGIMEAARPTTPGGGSVSARSSMSTVAALPCSADGLPRTSETATNSCGSVAASTAPPDVDLTLLGWWRSMAEEDIGLPSARIYLTQVYTELQRIVSARAALRPPSTLSARAVEPCPLDSAQVCEDTGAGAVVGSGSKSGANLTDGTPVGVAEDSAVFSPSEVVIIVRALSSIASRGVATATLGRPVERGPGRGASGKASGAGSADNAPGGAAVSVDGDSIMDALRRAAVYAAGTAAKRAPSTTTMEATQSKGTSASSPPIATCGADSGGSATMGAAEETTEQDGTSTAALSVQKVVQQIEEALLSSLTVHSCVLPAITIIEATWLRLFPLSRLQKVLDHRESSEALPTGPLSSSLPCNAVSSEPLKVQLPAHSPHATAAAPTASSLATKSRAAFASFNWAPHLDGSLREATSPWLRTLHDAVLTSRHSCHIVICFVSSFHALLATSDRCNGSDEAASTSNLFNGSHRAGRGASLSCDGTPEATLLSMEGCGNSPNRPSLIASRLRHFLMRLRTSCAEAVIFLHRTRKQHTRMSSASGHGDTSDADVSGSSVKSVAAATADGGESGAEAAITLHTAEPHQEHGRRFCNLLILTSELHDRLLAYAEAITWPAAWPQRTKQDGEGVDSGTSRNVEVKRRRRQLRLLYAALLDAVSEFVPYGEHGGAVEVMQMLGVITCRMPWQQFLEEPLKPVMPVVKDGHPDDDSSSRTETAAAPLAKRRECLVEGSSTAAVLGAICETDEGGVSIDPLLVCFREKVTRLMPYVDAEVLRCTKPRSPSLLSLALICSAKSSVEYALRSLPFGSSRSTGRPQGGTGVTSATVTRAGSDVGLSPAAPTAVQVRTSESVSHDTRGGAAPEPLGFFTQPFWSQAPLESLLHRVATDRFMASRHALFLCTLAANAPEFSMTLLPLTYYLRDARARISWGMMDVVFKAVAVSAVSFQRHNQEEMILRADHSALSPLSLSGSDRTPSDAASSPEDRAGPASVLSRPRQGVDDSNAPQRGGFTLPRSSTEGSSLRVGEMRHPHGGNSAASVPLFRSAAVSPPTRAAPSPLRQVWGDLARRLLQEEDDLALCDVSLWVSALYCGAMVNCAGTVVFEQLLASLVFGGTTPTTSAAITTGGRIARLDIVGWSLLLEACGTASDHRCRQTYRALLRDEFLGFLERVAAAAGGDEVGVASPSTSFASSKRLVVSAAASCRTVLDEEVVLAGARLCKLLEAIPQLFIEDARFWCGVKGCVESWCAAIAIDPAEGAGEVPSAPQKSASAVRLSWVTQLQQSFNWAAQSAGQLSLMFKETWTTTTTAAATGSDVDAVAEWMQSYLNALGAVTATAAGATGPLPSGPTPRGTNAAFLGQ
ncbi:hypothetical protein JKF63_03603 [Porcisia hertigi]|uniref:Uncharacterized protein n=1 Tax=Porcisia hertigi TaxID=2761500 RepID=A0A836L6V1_9TRYP|nr:hypothetical protein JKF63_03603 [Porcisia hertigi]